MGNFASINMATINAEPGTVKSGASGVGTGVTYQDFSKVKSYNSGQQSFDTGSDILNTARSVNGTAKNQHNVEMEDIVSINGLEMSVKQAIENGLLDPDSGDTAYGQHKMSQPNELTGDYKQPDDNMTEAGKTELQFSESDHQMFSQVTEAVPVDVINSVQDDFINNEGFNSDAAVDALASHFGNDRDKAEQVIDQIASSYSDSVSNTVEDIGVPDAEMFYDYLRDEAPERLKDAMREVAMEGTAKAFRDMAADYVTKLPYVDPMAFEATGIEYTVKGDQIMVSDGIRETEWSAAVMSGMITVG